MPLVGIVAPKKDIQAMRKDLKLKNIQIIRITKENIKNLKNIQFREIIFLEDINLPEEEYQYINEIISKAKYIILNSDIEIKILNKIKIEQPIRFITFGFNSKSTVTISSVKDEKVIVCLQRDIQKTNGQILEYQEKEVSSKNNKRIYNILIVFIIKELNN